jgi:hypothetical protein
MTFTFPKWGFGSLPGLPKLQSSIIGVKTPRIGAFFISLESYRNVDVESVQTYENFEVFLMEEPIPQFAQLFHTLMFFYYNNINNLVPS